MSLAALIFDVDGTLAETEEAHRIAFNAAFAAAGLSWHWDQSLYAKLLAVTGGKERIKYFLTDFGGAPTLDAATIANLHADKTARYTAAVAGGGLVLRPGIRRLLDEAEKAGLRLAIATTTSPANVTALLHATLGPHGPERFAVIGAGDCVPAKKPAPDIYHYVLDRLNLPAASCIAFEDTPNGLLAASGAGIRTIITLSLYGPPLQSGTDYADALLVLDHLGEPDQPCHVYRGAAPASPTLTLADLKAFA
jgi:beta-phosphoglucomutase-like phosphatase (HAD superfamily)